MRKFILLLLLSCLYLSVFGQTVGSIDLSGLPKPTQAESLRYWFDNDIGSLQATKQHNGLRTIDVASLFEGLHTLHYQIIDNEGTAAVPYSSIFMKLSESVNAKAKYVRYWFDNDTEALKADAINGVMMLDASELLEGLHTIHYQVVDDSGTATTPYSSLFMKLSASVNSKAKEVRYWFDNDTYVQKADAVNGVMMLDASQLLEGLHTIHYQVVDDSGTATTPYSAIFMKLSLAGKEVTASRIIYWFDDDAENIQNAEMSNGVQILDASSLIDGLHTIHYQVICSDGTLTSVYSSLFLRINVETGTTVAKSLRYWFDDQTNVSETEISNETQILDVSDLIQGLHTLHCQIVDTNGTLGIPMSSIFMKLDINTELSHAKRQRYWFDDDKSTVVEEDIVGGIQSLDVSGLLTGLHTLHYQLLDEQGNVSVPYSAIFMKMFEQNIPEGGNVITRYMYWVNDDSKNNQKVDIENPSNPYNLISLLPMVKVPIRSSDFKFELTNGKPMMYAKNDFHIRFYDAAGYWVDDAKSFVDYSISQEVTDIVELQSTQTFARPAENAVKWFKIDVEKGDTVAFKSSQATSIQLLSSVGEEVYSADGSKSVEFGGCRILENGTYYVAIHDVTGSKPNVTLDYMHMDKYDVVDQDVRVVGNGGCSSITYHGNGFRDLYAVDLYTESGDTIHSVDVNFISDATTMVTFDFSDAEIGKYNALFHFTGENKKFLNNITVEAARDIELATTVSYPSAFLRGTSTTYTIEIKNKGNMTAYMVPLEIKLIVENVNDIQNIKFDGYLQSLTTPSLSEIEGLEVEDINDIKSIVEGSNDLCQFIIYHDSVQSKDYGLAQIIMSLPPNSTQSFTVSIMSTTNIHLEAWTTSGWFPLIFANKSIHRAKGAKALSRETMCCMKDKFECGAEIVANIAGAFMPPGVGCLSSLALTGLETAYDVWCSEGNSASERWNNYLKNEGNSLAGRLIQSAVTCVTGYYAAKLKVLREDRVMAAKLGSATEVERITSEILECRAAMNGVIRNLYDGITTMILGGSCYKAFTETKPNCPPNPDGGGGTSTPINSCEPNDIRGYTSESGSTFMRNDVEEVTYIIDSENDPVFADAPAHTVIITDTINGEYYDLESLSTRNITIGDVSMDLDGTEQNFIKTMDLRPRINVIAQVEQKYDTKTGIAKWIWTSLDPMTMEPTDDVMQGVLPVNDETHIGEGHVSFKLKQKTGLPNGTDVTNQADIVFDSNEPVFTPVWTNTIDAIAPISAVVSADIKNDTTATLKIRATDNLSGPWKYDVYVRYGSEGSSWYKAVEGATTEDIDVKYYKDLVHAFCVVATDSAGNVEKKELIAEFELSNGVLGDANLDGFVNVNDITTIAKFILEGKVSPWSKVNADANEDGTINVNDITKTAEIILLRAKAEMEAKAAMEAAFKAAHSED